ncbi:hypothetical protein [Bradyrhizobium genosp. P]|uniref:hypothetical protein n=1 Tax=Bradyrhizobium genosp. P TaxID=83641 RepID=UPI003CF280D0
MYDVYLSGGDLLVVSRGNSIPSGITGSWRKKKRVARSVSADIRDDVLLRGYHRRTLAKKPTASSAAKPRQSGFGHPVATRLNQV